MATAAVFQQLQTLLDAGDHAGALTKAQSSLGSTGDADLLKLIASLLIKLAKYEECITLAASHPDHLAFEGAYAAYRLDRFPAVNAAVASHADDGEQWQWLAAQTAYRSGDAGAAVTAYTALAASSAEELEATVNLTAAAVVAGTDPGALVPPTVAGEMEVAFNLATGQLTRGDAAGAAAALAAAAAAAATTLAGEGLTPAEVAVEVAPLHLQRAVALQSLGFAADATAAYDGALKASPSAQATAVANVNKAVARSGREIFEAYKRCKACVAGAAASKLLPSQLAVLQGNIGVLLAHMHKHPAALEAVQGLASPLADAVRAASDPAHAPTTPAGHVTRAAGCDELSGAADSLLAAAKASSSHAALPTLVGAYVRTALAAGQDPTTVAAAVQGVTGGSPDAATAGAAVLIASGHLAPAAPLASGVPALAAMAAASPSSPPGTPAGEWSGDVASLVDAPLPWATRRAPKATAPPSSGAAAGAGVAAPVVAPPALPTQAGASTAGVQLPAQERAARRKASRLRRRARKREEYVAALKRRPAFLAGVPLPKPDPERWLAYKMRSRDKFGNLKRSKAKTASASYKNTGSSQGTVGGDHEKASAALDARAQQQAEKAAGGSTKSAKKGSTAAAPKVAVKKRAKKGGRRR